MYTGTWEVQSIRFTHRRGQSLEPILRRINSILRTHGKGLWIEVIAFVGTPVQLLYYSIRRSWNFSTITGKFIYQDHSTKKRQQRVQLKHCSINELKKIVPLYRSWRYNNL